MPMQNYPATLRPGDFINLNKHFGDIFFEVLTCRPPRDDDGYWHVTYATYDKYSGTMREERCNSASSIRAIIPAEMAEPTMVKLGLRWKSSRGQYDPLYGYTPRGVPLRSR